MSETAFGRHCRTQISIESFPSRDLWCTCVSTSVNCPTQAARWNEFAQLRDFRGAPKCRAETSVRELPVVFEFSANAHIQAVSVRCGRGLALAPRLLLVR